MFDVGLPEIAVLIIAALFVFGPERLPTVVAQAARTLRQIRSLAAGARAEIDEAIGPELRDFNALAGLGELGGLRDQLSEVHDLTPRKILNDAMFGADDTRTDPAPAAPSIPGAAQPGPPDPGLPPAPPAVFDADAT
jgi:sec-independent protein translocase protein TatB